MENNLNQAAPKKKNRVWIPIAGISLIVILSGIYFYRQYTKYISTDDAKIESDNVNVSPKIMGRITALHADEGDSVQKGMLLVELDSSDMLAQKKQLIALKDQAVAAVSQAQAAYNAEFENIKVQEIVVANAQEDLNRAKLQIKGEVISQEKFDQYKNAFDRAQAQLDAQKTKLLVSRANIAMAEATVRTADAQVGVVNSQLNNTRIYAPMDAIVAKRWLLPGDIAMASQSIFSLTSKTKNWVSIFIEETRISDIFIGQKLNLTVDAYPGVTFDARITFIGANTSAQFSLIPASNAAGNFTKVTQRIPLKAEIYGTEDHSSLSKYDFRSGMSVVVKIIRK